MRNEPVQIQKIPDKNLTHLLSVRQKLDAAIEKLIHKVEYHD
jgi:hypothetical protein